MSIIPEPAKALAAQAEVIVLRKALACNPGSPAPRLRTAALLNELDRFDETIALLTPSAGIALEELHVLSVAHFARNAPDDLDRASEVTARAVSLAATARQRSRALAEQAKALLRREQLCACRSGSFRNCPPNPTRS
ncbi:MAG TPA: hypothetical protein VHG29_01840 [Novosphingobium sp.]|nr:hypothetical protein [Novosphingobium sp.]